MIKVERLENNMVFFTDLDSDVGFHCDCQEGTFRRLVHHPELQLDEENCVRLYREMLKYHIIFINGPELFRKPPLKETPFKPMVPVKPGQEQRELDDMLVASMEKVEDMLGEKRGTEIVGIRYDR